MEAERDRLDRLYRELGDDHLKDLADDVDDLTDDARMALAQEMQRRGFAPTPHGDAGSPVTDAPELESGFGPAIPGIVPSGAAAVEQALEPSGEERLGWATLIAFYDGLELSRACGFLEDSDVEFALEEKNGDAMSGVPPHFALWVPTGDVDLGQRVLREKMGLFPLAEANTDGDLEGTDLLPLAHFDTSEEADRAAALLGHAGILYSLLKPEEGDEAYGIEVPAADHDRALEVVAAGLTSEPAAKVS